MTQPAEFQARREELVQKIIASHRQSDVRLLAAAGINMAEMKIRLVDNAGFGLNKEAADRLVQALQLAFDQAARLDIDPNGDGLRMAERGEFSVPIRSTWLMDDKKTPTCIVVIPGIVSAKDQSKIVKPPTKYIFTLQSKDLPVRVNVKATSSWNAARKKIEPTSFSQNAPDQPSVVEFSLVIAEDGTVSQAT